MAGLKRAERSIARLCSPTALMGFSVCPLGRRAAEVNWAGRRVLAEVLSQVNSRCMK